MSLNHSKHERMHSFRTLAFGTLFNFHVWFSQSSHRNVYRWLRSSVFCCTLFPTLPNGYPRMPSGCVFLAF